MISRAAGIETASPPHLKSSSSSVKSTESATWPEPEILLRRSTPW
jgi:hypothetical protein